MMPPLHWTHVSLSPFTYQLTSTDGCSAAVNSDLYFKIGPDGLTGRGLTEQGFAHLWAAAKATWGAKGGKVFYEVKVVEYLIVDLADTEEHPNALR